MRRENVVNVGMWKYENVICEMKYFSHLNSAAEILRLYKGEQPFHYFIKEFFRQHKKYGSKDRRSIGSICYAYWRLGKSFPSMAMEARLLAGLFLCAAQPDEILQSIKPEWNAAVHLSPE